MPTKVFVFSLLLLILLGVGMTRYAALVSTDVAPTTTSNSEPTADEAVPEGVTVTDSYVLPLTSSAPTTNVRHTIPLEDIRQGCFRQDCIPSVDSPEFVKASDLADVLDPGSLGIVIAGVDRFYPFPMLETREIVNDYLPSGEPVAVTYCPLCGTGIVFNRELDGEAVEFGVSGMLWQSNLLMYNRAGQQQDRNLWSQVLGQAVVGDRAGQVLPVVPSDIITFADWLERSPNGDTLTTGTPRDPYGGDYFATAQNFRPDFNAADSELAPTERVHGIIVNGQAKAYVSSKLTDGLTDFVGTERIFIEKKDGVVKFLTSNAENGLAPTQIPDVEGFWFSWAAAHPDTELWNVE